MTFLPRLVFALAIISSLFVGGLRVFSFERSDWDVRCWNPEKRLWENVGLEKMTVVERDGVTEVTNTSGVHRHAHLVFPAALEGDFTFTIELKGGYELGFLNREGKDEMLYLELGEADAQEFRTYELSRVGTRISISRDGRPAPLVHFRIDYGEPFLITLAIKDGESAAICAYRLETDGAAE